ncbi:MAG: hypothetical protein B7Y90_01240 [Alphaproteobacteria bacterium 32-64-14]|nr:MAG: hypothetical protein B7Y90_01240 [Alphaproteobacteria bacterium 32-64-14]
MENAKNYVGAFIVGALAAIIGSGALGVAFAPNDPGLMLAVAVAAGIVGGIAAATIAPARSLISRLLAFVQGW